jgi:hypothetical protein
MKPIPITPQTLNVASNIIWFEPPEQALADPVRFMAYAMTYALPEDMRFIRQYVSDDDFREALDLAPPGIIDPRSWAYWNSKMGRYPPPPAPIRRFGVDVDSEQPIPTRGNQSTRAPAKGVPPDEQRARARKTWRKLREQQSSTSDLEEIRRRARENWRAKYGPGKKS